MNQVYLGILDAQARLQSTDLTTSIYLSLNGNGAFLYPAVGKMAAA